MFTAHVERIQSECEILDSERIQELMHSGRNSGRILVGILVGCSVEQDSGRILVGCSVLVGFW
eukprot:COSAG01_NODE_1133_length_11566_cov_25.815819_12_plen_63_part_00